MLPNEPRTVKPRRPTPKPWLPILACDRQTRSAFCESTGEVYGWDDIPGLVRAHPSLIVVAPNAAHLVTELEEVFGGTERWQYRVTPVKREAYNPDPTRRRRITHNVIVNYFGWSGPDKKRGHWHYPLDPVVFSLTPLRELLGGTDPHSLLTWAQDVREWCTANNLHPSPTAGGLGGQLLRDPRWYPEPRRKVPRATNARARSVLPGNHYRLYWPEGKTVDASCIDMSSAHHVMASQIKFPCANTLYARGNFRTTETPETPPLDRTLIWARPNTSRYNALLQSYGLLRVWLRSPALKPMQFPLPYMEQMGVRLAWVHTNELPLIHSLGGIIEGIDAAWVSHEQDTGLNQYAVWALTETATMTPRRKQWCKTVLLSTYGNLAAKARAAEYGYRNAQSGIPREYPAGPNILHAYAHLDNLETEIGTVNVIHRGMIEAEQRRVVLDMARDLHEQGHTVLSLYADAILIKSDRALAFLPSPWRLDGYLTRLRFVNATSFVSEERTKLPGVTGAERARWQRILHKPGQT